MLLASPTGSTPYLSIDAAGVRAGLVDYKGFGFGPENLLGLPGATDKVVSLVSPIFSGRKATNLKFNVEKG